MIKLLALAVSAFVMAFLAIFSPLFEIKSVSFNDDQNCIEDSDQVANELLIGTNSIFFKPENIAQILEDRFVCIDSIAIDRQYPQSVVIDIKSKDAIAQIAETNFQVTKDGLVVKADDRAQIPTIYLPSDQKLNINEQITDKSILASLQITANLLKSDFVPTTVRIIDDEEIAVYSNIDVLATFSSKKDPRSQVDSLQLILAEAKIDATKIDKIDFRFENPVISYK